MFHYFCPLASESEPKRSTSSSSSAFSCAGFEAGWGLAGQTADVGTADMKILSSRAFTRSSNFSTAFCSSWKTVDEDLKYGNSYTTDKII